MRDHYVELDCNVPWGRHVNKPTRFARHALKAKFGLEEWWIACKCDQSHIAVVTSSAEGANQVRQYFNNLVRESQVKLLRLWISDVTNLHTADLKSIFQDYGTIAFVKRFGLDSDDREGMEEKKADRNNDYHNI